MTQQQIYDSGKSSPPGFELGDYLSLLRLADGHGKRIFAARAVSAGPCHEWTLKMTPRSFYINFSIERVQSGGGREERKGTRNPSIVRCRRAVN